MQTEPAAGRTVKAPAWPRMRKVLHGPLALLPDAIRAVPAVKYALAALAVAGCAAAVLGYFRDAKLALIATIAGLGLMGVMLIFASAAALKAPVMRHPAVVFVWGCLLLFMVWAAAMTSSVFVGWPLQISVFGSEARRPDTAPRPPSSSRDDTTADFAIVVPDASAVAMMTPSQPSPFSIAVGDRSVAMPEQGVLIGPQPWPSLSSDVQQQYRQRIPFGEPVWLRVDRAPRAVGAIRVHYENRLCAIIPTEQHLWPFRFDTCD